MIVEHSLHSPTIRNMQLKQFQGRFKIYKTKSMSWNWKSYSIMLPCILLTLIFLHNKHYQNGNLIADDEFNIWCYNFFKYSKCIQTKMVNLTTLEVTSNLNIINSYCGHTSEYMPKTKHWHLWIRICWWSKNKHTNCFNSYINSQWWNWPKGNY